MIDYAPKRRRRWKRRALILLATLALLAGATYRFGPPAYKQAHLLVLQRLACWQQPADGALVADTQGSYASRNRAFDKVVEEVSSIIGFSSPRPGQSGTVFCGHLTIGGKTYLLGITAEVSANGMTIQSWLLEPAGLKSHVKAAMDTFNDFDPGQLAGFSSWSRQSFKATRLRLFAGHLIPGQYPLITFAYEIDGREGTCGLRLYERNGTIESVADVLPPK